MNGDLSLSQSLGGLRIANPDDNDVNSAHPSQHHSRDSDALPQSLPQLDSHGRLDVTSSLGFDPTAYTFDHPSSPALPQHAPRPRSPSDPTSVVQRRLSQRHQPPPTAGQRPLAPQQTYHTDRQYYQQPVRTPSYSGPPPPMGPSSASAAYPPGHYQRIRAETSQSASAELGRNQSRAAAAAAMGMPPTQRTPSGRAPPASHSAQAAVAVSSAYPPRRSSKPSPASSDYNLGRATSQPTPHHASPTSDAPISSSEEWKDRGAAVGMQASVDANGRQTTMKVVKKGVKDFTFGRTLGEGSYSTVLAATDRQSSREYAIKVLDKRHIIKEKKVKYVNIEKDTLNRLTDHPGIVRLYYTFQDERSLYFVLDLATGGELLGVLKKTSSFDEECTRFYSGQILDAVEYMHSKGIIHRDLKPENVLLDDAGHVKITDFGTAKILEMPKPKPKPTAGSSFGQVSVSNDPLDGADQDRAVSFVGTAEYVSPELLTDKNACKASDLWAFGCIVYQLIAGRPPFKANGEYLTFQKIVNLEYTFPEGFPPAARDLVEKLLVLDPAERMPIPAIKRHPFFDGLAWGKGLWKQQPPRLRPHNPYRKPDPQPPRHPASSDSVPQSSRSSNKPSGAVSSSSGASGSKYPPKVITALAPPSQLDIDWSPVLNRPNERILKLGNLIVYSMPAPYSPTSKNGAADTPTETPSKFSRFFGASATKKRQRLVMVSSAARLILAPSGGDKKEAKQVIDLQERDVSVKSQQDAKGYTIWSVSTRDRHLTFEDSKANTGDAGSSVRTTQEWLDTISSAKDFAASSRGVGSPEDPGYSAMSPSSLSNEVDPSGGDAAGPLQPPHRGILRRGPASDDDTSLKGRKRFSKRHSKNGLAAVF